MTRTTHGTVALALVLAASLLAQATTARAQAPGIDTTSTAREVAESIAADPSTVTGATWVERTGGTPTAVGSAFLSGFPRDGVDYGILTTGNAALADDANTSGNSGVDNGGRPVRGDTDYDVTVLRIDLDVPTGSNCLVGIEFRFLSDEYPEYVGSSYNDAFVLELDQTTWTTSGSTISAPDNFAFDPAGNVISINAAGETSMSAIEADGTTYDGATPVLSAATPIDPGSHQLYLSIFDQGDNIYDSAVFVDDLRFGRVADVARDCRPGAQVVDVQEPLPLLGAHGITGAAEDMVPNLRFAEDQVDDLPDTLSTDTAAVGSVWSNSLTLQEDAQDLADRNQSGAVNVIAHSKGGLDTRAAMWRNPDLYEDLAMLATPNGGSGLADTLCNLRRFGIDGLFAEMGPCDSQDDGLYNLQTDYISDVYNAIVVDSPQHDIWIAAGDCMGFVGTEEGRLDCNGTNLLGHGCTDVDGPFGQGDADGENAVCVWSAFAQVAGFDPGGSHIAIDPVFQGRNHTDMRTDACPNTAVLARVYGPYTPDNPWIVGNPAACEGLPTIDGSYRSAGLVPTAATAAAPPAPDDGAHAGLDPVGFELQAIRPLTLSDQGTASLDVDDEGATLGLAVMADPGVLDAVERRAADGTLVPAELAGDVDVFGLPGSSTSIHAPVGAGTVEVRGTPGAQVAVTTAVDSDVRADLDVVVRSATEAELTVTLEDASPSTARPSTVRAFVPSTSGRVAVDVPLDGVNGSLLTYRTTVAAVAGQHQPVDVEVLGPHPRSLTGGYVVPDGTGAILGLLGDAEVDTDGDGVADTLSLDVAVSTEVAGSHELSLVLESDGDVVGSGPGTADLVPGDGTITVEVPFSSLASAGRAGPYGVVDLVLTRGPGREWIARADTIGTTGAVGLDGLGAGRLDQSRPAATPLDTDADGMLDTLRWTWTTWAPDAGDYEFEGLFIGPTATELDRIAVVQTLEAGPNVVQVDLEGALVGEHVAGRYSLVDVVATSAADSATWDRAPAGVTEALDPAGWLAGTPDIDTLIGLWRTANGEGGIYTVGLYRSELNRLLRVVDDLDGDDVASARDGLARFRSHVWHRENKFEPGARLEIIGYTDALLATLDG